jgi:geranylgeranyl diphosphate synthase type II
MQAALDYLKKISELTEQKLEEHLPPVSEAPSSMHEAMRYSTFAGGKRLRPALAYAAFEAFEGKGESIFYVTSALEMFHTFSLIHDDLPCMDDDDFRRGKPTCHKKFGEAAAVLAGDALCIHAFELLAKTGDIRVISTLGKALGTQGMIGGQIVDIESEGQDVDMDTVNFIHYRKTAALIEASLLVGGQAAGAPDEDLKPLSDYGWNIGLAFQIIDDILDIEQTTEQLGKDAGSDAERGKATYPALIGLDASKARAKEHFDKALAALGQLKKPAPILEDIASFIIQRMY